MVRQQDRLEGVILIHHADFLEFSHRLNQYISPHCVTETDSLLAAELELNIFKNKNDIFNIFDRRYYAKKYIYCFKNVNKNFSRSSIRVAYWLARWHAGKVFI